MMKEWPPDKVGAAETNPSPHPPRSSLPPSLRAMAGQARGEGEYFLGALTQGGARSSLALGYYRVIPTGFQSGSVRSPGDEAAQNL